MITKKTKELSIQVNLSGLSFSVTNSAEKNKIEFLNTIKFKEKLTPFEVLNRLKEELASNTVFSEDFKNVSVIHYNELATLVPKELYDEAHNAEYLKFNTKILKTDFIASDALENQDIVSVYVPFVNINNYIFDTFGSFTYKHASSVFIDTLLSKNSSDGVYVYVQGDSMQVVTIKEQLITLYNFFEYNTPEDFIYYMLFTCEQQKLDPEKLHLKFFGWIKEDDKFFEMAYKYIRHIELEKNSEHYLIKNSM